MSGKEEGSPLSGGADGWSLSEAKRKSIVDDCEDDDSLLTRLSLGSTPTTGARRDGCLPATPTPQQAPLRPVNVASAPSSAAAAAVNLTPPPSATTFDPGLALGLAVSSMMVHGNGSGGGALFLASGALLTASKLESTLLPLPTPTPHFPSGGSGNGLFPAVPVEHDNGIAPAGTRPVIGSVTSSTSLPAKREPTPAPPKKRRRVTNRSNKKSAAASHHGSAAPSSGDDHLSLLESISVPPFPWVKKNRVAEHYSLVELAERGIDAIEGEVWCKRCDVRKTLAFDVKAKFKDLRDFIARNVQTMDDRAPEEWKDPALPDCDECGQKNSLRPVISPEKAKINWMFLLLGQTLGLCTLEQLKHFCAHTNQHRTGAKDRVLYSTYMELCNQLWPGGPFDMAFERKNRNRLFA